MVMVSEGRGWFPGRELAARAPRLEDERRGLTPYPREPPRAAWPQAKMADIEQ